jgi:hypothetical protein
LNRPKWAAKSRSKLRRPETMRVKLVVGKGPELIVNADELRIVPLH